MGKVMQPFRLSLVGAKALTYDIVELIGKKKRSQEFKSCSKFIKKKVDNLGTFFIEDNIPFSIPDFL
jgi:hypothetical protein